MNGSTNSSFYMNNDKLEITGQVILPSPHRVAAIVLGVIAISFNIVNIIAIARIRRSRSSHYKLIIR